MAVTRTTTREEKTFVLTLQGQQFPTTTLTGILKGWGMVVNAFGQLDGEDYTATTDYLDVALGFSEAEDELTLTFRGTQPMVDFFMQQLGVLGM